jgi:hypothetical protein
VVALIAGFVMWQTSYGVHTKAIGSNREGALRSGIAVRRHLVSIYLISGALAGVGGVMSLAQFSTLHHHDRRPHRGQPDHDRRHGARRHQPVRRRGDSLRHGGRHPGPGHPAERVVVVNVQSGKPSPSAACW